jgi:hypothetical protein
VSSSNSASSGFVAVEILMLVLISFVIVCVDEAGEEERSLVLYCSMG